MSFSIRRFLPEDVSAYRAIRLEALQMEPGMFGNSHATESSYEDRVWQARLENPLVACFGLYHAKTLIGLTSIVSDEEKPGEAYMTQSYIRKAYRGRGLSRMLYEARFAWAKEQGIQRFIIGHRESNLVSKAANQRYGFKYTHRVARVWPDGAAEDMLYYMLEF
jgi:RimJ/RimL family protein N-acetyltransferase